ncbi:MAG: nucleotidyl transferase AbiEii/AbiGii toxin family protein [Gemmatimonadaceae bacterium]
MPDRLFTPHRQEIDPLLTDGPLTFREFAMAEPLPLARVQATVLAFLRGRDDVVLFGAQAVYAWVDAPRMTETIDVIALDGAMFADALRLHLATSLGMAVRVREVARGRGLRLYQVRKEGNRHLVDVQLVDALPPSEPVAGVQVASPPALLALKVLALAHRRGQPKAGTDWRDIALLLLRFPDLKCDPGPVSDQLAALDASDAARAEWRRIVAEPIEADMDDPG